MTKTQTPLVRIGSTVEHCGRKFTVEAIRRDGVVIRRGDTVLTIARKFFEQATR